MGREKALAFVCISIVAVILVLKNAHVLHSQGYLTRPGTKNSRETAPHLEPAPRQPEVHIDSIDVIVFVPLLAVVVVICQLLS